jgi:hypothetical protein
LGVGGGGNKKTGARDGHNGAHFLHRADRV